MEVNNTSTPVDDATSQTSPLANPPKKSKKNLLIFLVVGLVIIGMGIYFLRAKMQNKLTLQNQTVHLSQVQPTVIFPTDASKIDQKISFMSDGSLYTANLDGTNKMFVYKPSSGDAPYLSWDWSPDNTRIVTSNFIINLATKVQTPIPANGRCYNWSPDGEKIIYELNNGIAIMDSDGTNSKQIAPGGTFSSPLCRGSNDVYHWLADSKSFVYPSNDGINKFDITTNTNTLIFNSNITKIYPLSVSVSKDGNRIVFVGRINQTIDNIYIANNDGSNVQELTNFTQSDIPSAASFTLDGGKIVFLVDSLNSKYKGISLLNIESKTIKVLSSAGADSYYPSTISSDGQYVAYDSNGGLELATSIINLQTGAVKKLPYSVEHLLWSK